MRLRALFTLRYRPKQQIFDKGMKRCSMDARKDSERMLRRSASFKFNLNDLAGRIAAWRLAEHPLTPQNVGSNLLAKCSPTKRRVPG